MAVAMKPSIVIRGGAAASADLGSSSSYSNEIVISLLYDIQQPSYIIRLVKLGRS